MIHPSSLNPTGNASQSGKSLLVYYLTALTIAGFNFVPLFTHGDSLHSPVRQRTVYLLMACYFLAAPLLFEYLLDVAVWVASSHSVKHAGPRFGNFLMLLSMILPISIVHGPLEHAKCIHSALFVDCFVFFLQSLIIIAQYRKLQDRYWTVGASLLCIVLFVASQLGSSYAIIYSLHDHKSYDNYPLTVSLALYFAFGVLCMMCHRFHCKQYIYEWCVSKYRRTSPVVWDTNDYVFFALQVITGLYFTVNFVTALIFLVDRYDSQYYVNTDVITHIILGLAASILPGRMVKKNLIVLNEKMVNKDTFIRYVSHEIRSPLSTTSLGLKYLLDKLSSRSQIPLSEVRIVVQESLVTCELAMNTLNDFLMLDKIQTSVLDISATVCQASDFLIDAIRPFSMQAEANNTSLVCNVESLDGATCPDVAIRIDAYKMNQVLRNLLSNALKFTPSLGKVTVTMTFLECNAEQSQAVSTSKKYIDGTCSMVRIEVKDSGCGIHKANLPKLFGQYVQFDADKLQGGKGSGLGLWLSKAIVELHGGRVGATSEGIGKGCTFWFELPCELSTEDRASVAGIVGSRSSFVSRNFSRIHETPQSITTATDSLLHATVEDGTVYDVECGLNSRYELTAVPGKVELDRRLPSLKKFVDLQIDVAAQEKTRQRTTSFSPQHYKRSAGGSNSAPGSATTEVAGMKIATDTSVRVAPFKVLLVDDSAIARKMVERSMRGIDAVCHHAHTGRVAVEMVLESMQSNEPFDVVLMDHYMPEMNGPEAVLAMRLKGYTGIIFGVSGMASSDVEFDRLVDAGKINRIIAKPFSLDLFLDYMKEYESCAVSATNLAMAE